MIRSTVAPPAAPGLLRFALILAASLACGTIQAHAQAAKPAAAASPNGLFPGGNSKEPINIEADKLEYFNKEGKAIYTGNVVAVQGDTTLKCSKLTIFMEKEKQANGPKQQSPASSADSPSNSGVRHMDIEGPVTLYSKDQVGTGDRGEYDKPSNKALLYGHVVLTQGSNITKGDKLTYNLTTGEALVESDSAGTGRVSGYFVPNSAKNADATPAADAKPAKEKPAPKAPPKKGAKKKTSDDNG